MINRFGKPYQEGTQLKNEQTVKTISYAYSAAAGSSLYSGVTPARAMSFYFADNILVGYEFTSSFKADNSYFDENKVSQIKKGKTTRDQVIELMGKPAGMHLYPLIKNKGDKAIVYLYTHFKRYKIYHQILVASFNNNGLVTDVSFTSSGQK